jgi:hypothetical protein
VTVRVVDPLTLADAAEIVVVPGAMPLARPAPLMVATELFEEFQLTELVRFCVLPSLYVPVAVNCCVAPGVIAGLAGVTAIDDKTAAVTVSVVDPAIVPELA